MLGRTPKDEIVMLEKRYWQALKDGDVETALALTDDPCIITGAQGVGTLDHETFRGMMENASWEIERYELGDEIEVRMVGDDVAIVAYKVREELKVDGAPVIVEAADASTWVRKRGRWVCALHTESLAGDPFGRDRKPLK